MIEAMAQVHMSEAEVARNFAAALEEVRQGLEVVVEHDHQAVAVLRPALPPRLKISEVLARMPKNSNATMDADFARDVEAAIEGHREPLDPPRGIDPGFLGCDRSRAPGVNRIPDAGSHQSTGRQIRKSRSRL
jgi:antitoxin (DNA-binding transcriptional repressor) of toxin-antitoxin stability system